MITSVVGFSPHCPISIYFPDMIRKAKKCKINLHLEVFHELVPGDHAWWRL